jgi:uroporphyrin-III C-methyltransferase/precorrin-2 dehydrogenase/sirohydrochlorin ferrochelatase
MDYFPLFANLKGRRVLIVGGGQVALRKYRLVAAAGAAVTLVAPKLCHEIQEHADAGEVDVLRERFAPAHIADHLLVIAATSDEASNAAVAQAAAERARLCNVVDDPSRCSFIMPAIVQRGPVTVAISTGGRSPTLARWLKARLERLLPARVGDLAQLSQRWRDTVVRRFARGEDRQRFWLDVFAGPVVDDVLAGRMSDAQRRMTRALEKMAQGGPREGEAYLVGAGPGDAELITLRGAKLLSEADIVMHDALVSASVLELARRDATFINVGKRAGHHSMKQDDITALLVRLVGEGNRVCRLKGGDPFLFGRGGEEALALQAAGHRFQVVPGVTAASACGAYAGIPLTHRGVADSVTFVTAHGCEPGSQPDWSALSDPRRTVVFYMGVRRLVDIGRGLIHSGRAATTPVAIVQNGSTRDQRTRITTLAALASGSQTGVAGPAAVIVGDVVRLAESLQWFEPASSHAQLMSPQPASLVAAQIKHGRSAVAQERTTAQPA